MNCFQNEKDHCSEETQRDLQDGQSPHPRGEKGGTSWKGHLIWVLYKQGPGSWAQIPALTFTSWVTLDKSVCLFELQFLLFSGVHATCLQALNRQCVHSGQDTRHSKQFDPSFSFLSHSSFMG